MRSADRRGSGTGVGGPWRPAALAATSRTSREHADGRAASVTLVTGAVGGVGASTLAALLACELAKDGAAVGLLDLDHLNGGIDVLLGAEGRPGARWPELAEVSGPVEAADLDDVLLSWRGVEVLSVGRRPVDPRPGAVAAVVAALVARHEHLVVDVPAAGLRAATELGAAGARAHVLVLTGQDVRGLAGALAIRDGVPEGRAGLVLRARREAVVAAAEAAELLGLPLVATLPRDRSLAGAVDRGLGPLPPRRSALARAVRRIATRVDGRG